MPPSPPRTRQILYASDLGPGSTSTYRFGALRRLGQQMHPFDVASYSPKSRAFGWLRARYPVGPLVSRINRDLVKVVQTTRPDTVWFDKPLFFPPPTRHAIQQARAKIVFYLQDAPFGPRNDGCWTQFLKVFRMADLHCLFR